MRNIFVAESSLVLGQFRGLVDDHLDYFFTVVFWNDKFGSLARLFGHSSCFLLLETLSKQALIVATSLVIDLTIVVPRLSALGHDLRCFLTIAYALVEVLSCQLALDGGLLHLL